MSLLARALAFCTLKLTYVWLRIKNRYNEKPVDILPRYDPSADPNSDDEQVRAALRKAEAERMIADKGDVVLGELPVSLVPHLIYLELGWAYWVSEFLLMVR